MAGEKCGSKTRTEGHKDVSRKTAPALGNLLRWAGRFITSILNDKSYFWFLATGLVLFEIGLSILIVQKVPYTEIDWKAYMQEVGGFLSGERDYRKLKGDTGPLVYPAGFVYLYSVLYYLTSGGDYLRLAQYLFVGLYVATLIVVLSIYRRSSTTPPYVCILLVLSKRLHSVYMLRLFNGPWAMFFVYLSMLAMIKGRWRLAAVVFSFALSVKMNILLFAPGFAYLTLQATGIVGSLKNAAVALFVQVFLALPFIMHNAESYMTRAFDFGRVFMFKWTVNWRFVGAKVFYSDAFAVSLLAVHVLLIIALAAKWSGMYGGLKQVLWTNIVQHKDKNQRLPADHIILVMFSSNLVGIACARSLHYQFWSWYAHTLPYLAWQVGPPTTDPEQRNHLEDVYR
ncbi:glycosyltransferase [Gaertneriomyces semiglobifer]|nr:glycosyltransferase [Gaertneriomyces semiglobifer]